MFAIGRTLFVGLACAGFAAAQDSIPHLDYADLARTFLSEHGLKDWVTPGPAERRFDELLEGPVFVRVELGGLELCIPTKSLADGELADDFRATAAAMVEMEESWNAWLAPEKAAAASDDWKTLAKWVKGWSRGKLAHADGGKSLVESLDAGDSVRAAGERLRLAMREGDETCQAVGERGRIVLAPTRHDFVQLLAVAGSLDESARPNFWNDRLLERTIEWVGWTQVVSMEYTQLPVDPEKPFIGVRMNADDKTGQAQYMAERGAALLLRRQFWHQDAHFFEQTLAANLVIAATGKNNLRSGDWKLEYHTSGSSSPPYTRFVPGGNPNGGTLPPNPAGPGSASGNATEISLYRQGQGADHFLVPLHEGQLLGAKLVAKDKKHALSDDKLAHFSLHCFATREDLPVTAPFMGALAEKQPLPPNDFLDDYEDFFRAYRSGFFYWLQTKAMPSAKESEAKFAELIQAHAQSRTRELIDESVKTVYGVPLSNQDGSVDSLEWRYLAFLAKVKK